MGVESSLLFRVRFFDIGTIQQIINTYTIIISQFCGIF